MRSTKNCPAIDRSIAIDALDMPGLDDLKGPRLDPPQMSSKIVRATVFVPFLYNWLAVVELCSQSYFISSLSDPPRFMIHYHVSFAVEIMYEHKLMLNQSTISSSLSLSSPSKLAQSITLLTCIGEVPGFRSRTGHRQSWQFPSSLSPRRQEPE
jgi:hypothetical protein